MKGIYYDRFIDSWNNPGVNREDWPAKGESIVIDRPVFSRLFPDVEIRGEPESNVSIVFVDADEENEISFIATYSDEEETHKAAQFCWDWSGTGVTEHWFDDEAICLKSTGDYRSGSGLTASAHRIVAYKSHIRVNSFRGDTCGDETPREFPTGKKILAEFVNGDGGYRANWTGFALAMVEDIPIIGDDLDKIIQTVLLGEIPAKKKETVCRHNKNVRAIIISSEEKIPLYLCKSCRMRGVRWEEFVDRNRKNTCPYFRRACKSVVEKSDSFPEWFDWLGENLISSHLRLQGGDYLAYEVVYVRRKDEFVRRVVLLLNDETREAWMFPYNGFVPQTIGEFRSKYAEGRQINGYMGTGPADNYHEPEDKFLSEAKSDWQNNILLRHNGEEVYQSNGDSECFLLRIAN